MSIALPLCFVGALALGGVAVRRAGSRGFGHAGHWGHAGAGILLTTGRRVLVLLRSEDVTEPGTWNLAGGAVDSDEEPLVAGLREMEEETGLLLPYRTTKALGFTVWNSPDRSFRYTTSVVRVPEAFTKKRIELNWENDEHKWVDVAWLRANEAELHPGFRAKLTELITLAFDVGEVADVTPVVPSRPAGEPAAPDSAAFRRWFNASAVAWADGTPRQVVHQTHAAPFEVFERHRQPKGIDTLGSWFTSTRERLYGPRNEAVYLSLQNPRTFSGPGAWMRMYDEIERLVGTTKAKTAELKGAALARAAKEWNVQPNGHAVWTARLANATETWRLAQMKSTATRAGHDGVAILGDAFDGPTVQDAWVIFSPTQVKSATNNSGAYGVDEPRFNFNKGGEFVVRSPEAGRRLIASKTYTDNWRQALKVKPIHRVAVLVPCAGTKPFSEAPSHKHGYVPALQGLDVDRYVVAEPLGIVPWEWEGTWPNNAYDFPPEQLRGKGRELLAKRVRAWFTEGPGKRYDRIYFALPGHHGRLVADATEGLTLPVEDVSITACRETSCGDGVHRATSKDYVRWLRRRVKG
jgi:8-oxo-dGTP pyrophosphatase MutT (NUDIX family)